MTSRIILVFTAILLSTVTASSAKDMSNMFGPGYYHSDAPLGFRYWISSRVGMDMGFGFESIDQGDDNAISYWIGVGFPYVIYGNERANFFLRSGILISVLDDRVHGSGSLRETWTKFAILETPGVEVFFGDRFSLEVAHGIAIEIVEPPEIFSEDKQINISTFSGGISQLGFHFYFK